MVERQILLQLSPEDIKNLCSISENYDIICQDDTFWSEYLSLRNKKINPFPSKIDWYGDQYYQYDKLLNWMKLDKDINHITINHETINMMDDQEIESLKSFFYYKVWKRFWEIIPLTKNSYAIGSISIRHSFGPNYIISTSYDFNVFDAIMQDIHEGESLPELIEEWDETDVNIAMKLYQILENYGIEYDELDRHINFTNISEPQIKEFLRKFLNSSPFVSGKTYFTSKFNDDTGEWPTLELN